MIPENSFQAPVGGAISPVNDQFYEGGQFMPDTGLWCGIKKKAKRFAQVDRNWSDLKIQKAYSRKGYFVIVKYAGVRYEKYLNKNPIESLDEAKAFAEEVLRLRGAEYEKRGFVPHPTRLNIEG